MVQTPRATCCPEVMEHRLCPPSAPISSCLRAPPHTRTHRKTSSSCQCLTQHSSAREQEQRRTSVESPHVVQDWITDECGLGVGRSSKDVKVPTDHCAAMIQPSWRHLSVHRHLLPSHRRLISQTITLVRCRAAHIKPSEVRGTRRTQVQHMEIVQGLLILIASSKDVKPIVDDVASMVVAWTWRSASCLDHLLFQRYCNAM